MQGISCSWVRGILGLPLVSVTSLIPFQWLHLYFELSLVPPKFPHPIIALQQMWWAAVGVGLAGRSMDVVTEGVGNLVEYGITGSVGYHDDWICA
jgi:hypothetical protein